MSTLMRAVGALVLTLGLSGVVVIPNPTPAAALDDPHVVIIGGGWGHGRGMGQYGALGYARDRGWTSRKILDHFYQGTTHGSVPADLYGNLNPKALRVDLRYMSGRSTAVSLGEGSLLLTDEGGNGLVNVTDGAVRLTYDNGGFRLQTATGCSGPWTDKPRLSVGKVRIVANRPSAGPAIESSQLLKVCGPFQSSWYEGEIWAVTNDANSQRTINVVSVEQYLRGVVPNESPASWPDAALEAQAVAARSYVLAGDTRWQPYADTCDSIWCQVYDGRYTTRGGWRSSTHVNTDRAIAATAGKVRLRSNGTVARTEFSSSTGGHTAGGDFPAVVDEGDAVSANPNHRWESHISIATLENRYRLGDFVDMVVTDRNGKGPWGGRVERIEIRFAQGTKTMTGNEFRIAFGLKSDLFTVGAINRNPGSDPAIQMANVDVLYRRIVGRAPTVDESTRWTTSFVQDGERAKRVLATQLVHGPSFAGRLVDDLYQRALNRGADKPGRDYWLSQMQGSVSYEQVGTHFYGSSEYYQRSGNSNRSFVTSLYTNILGRSPDASGLDYWSGLMDEGKVSSVDVARLFYQSIESRRTRTRLIHRQVTGNNPTPATIKAGARYLVDRSDLDLAVDYAVALVADP